MHEDDEFGQLSFTDEVVHLCMSRNNKSRQMSLDDRIVYDQMRRDDESG